MSVNGGILQKSPVSASIFPQNLGFVHGILLRVTGTFYFFASCAPLLWKNFAPSFNSGSLLRKEMLTHAKKNAEGWGRFRRHGKHAIGASVENTLITLMIHRCLHQKRAGCSLKRQPCDIDATLMNLMWKLKIINVFNVLVSKTSMFHYCFIDDAFRKHWWFRWKHWVSLMITKHNVSTHRYFNNNSNWKKYWKETFLGLIISVLACIIKGSQKLPADADKFPPVTCGNNRQSIPVENSACIHREFYMRYICLRPYQAIFHPPVLQSWENFDDH